MGPRAGWQPPADQFGLYLLGDGRTLVTVPRTATGDFSVHTPVTGPVRLWDIETGQLRASHFGPDDVFSRVMVHQNPDLLLVHRRAGETDDSRHIFHLDLHDAWTGQTVASFTCHVPQDNVWWMLSPDVRTTAFVTFAEGKAQVEWHDVASGRLVQTLPGWREPICFSPDGRRFAATGWATSSSGVARPSAMAVFEFPTGREIARFTPRAIRYWEPPSPKEFSPDGTLLLDSDCNVWDLATGQRRFQVLGINRNGSLFTPDGQALVVVAGSTSECWLAYYDLTTGREQVERRVPLSDGRSPGGTLQRVTREGQLL